MPLPLILGVGAAAAAAVGVGGAVHGGVKMKQANDTMKDAQSKHEKNIKHFEEENKKTTTAMDELGKKELEILSSFKRFSAIFERIQNKPEFKPHKKDDVEIPSYDAEELEKVYVGAGVLLSGLSGAGLGAAGGFAAAGATTAAVMALGTASTGTAIASLSGIAATNATLAALGGGAIAAGDGGMALGTTILGATTLGVGLLVGGVIFNIAGITISGKADKAMEQMKMAQKEISLICAYLKDLYDTEQRFEKCLLSVNRVYRLHLDNLEQMVVLNGKTDWNQYSEQEKLVTENTVLLVNTLYQMCKVKLVIVAEGDSELNTVNHAEVEKSIRTADAFMEEKGFPTTA